jgi:hypothetical protein
VTSLPVTLIPKPYNCLYSLRQSRRLSGRVTDSFPVRRRVLCAAPRVTMPPTDAHLDLGPMLNHMLLWLAPGLPGCEARPSQRVCL